MMGAMDSSPARPFGVLAPRPRRTCVDGGGLCLAAPAKLNLDLWVGPRRDDGYHGLDSIVAKVTLYDDVVLRPRRDGRIVFRCQGADCGRDEENLALRAARLLAREAHPGGGAEILLSKSIPPGRGLGGGSSDAAAVLEGLNELWGLSLPPDALAELAAGLGSDVPLFLGPPAARMTGRGEVLQPVAVPPFVAVLHLPEIVCSSGEVYRRFDLLRSAVREVPRRDWLSAGTPPSRWSAELRNDLADAAADLSDELRRTRARLAERLGAEVSMTGSGSGLFVLCDDEEEAAKRMRRLPDGLIGRTVVVCPNSW